MLDLSPSIAPFENEPERLTLVCLIGSSRTLADACRVNLNQLCAAAYHLAESTATEVPSGCDIYIWDSESCPSLPRAVTKAENAIKVAIVDKKALPSVRRKLTGSDFTYLQSPVTPLSLRAVLEASIARLQLRGDASLAARRLKLDRDRILQKLLQTNLKLREHDDERTNFLTRSIHDIRVPLMAVQGYCGLLLAGQLAL